jgi:two-component system phosphate regulon response regulator PhoB
VVEDDADLCDLLRFNLSKGGYDCRCVPDGDRALLELRRQPPDLIVLDRMLPRLSGDEVAARVRSDPRGAAIPIIMLTAKAEEVDQLVGFALGATDYVTKPFSMKLLLARIAAALRRAESTEPTPQVLSAGPIVLDPTRYSVTVNGTAIPLTTTEFRILKRLMEAGRRVLDRPHLIDTVLGPMVAVTDRTIDVHVAALRKKLGAAAAWVRTVRGVGYAFQPPE